MPAKRAWGTAARSPVLTLLASVAVAALLASGATRLRPEADFVDTVPAGPEVDAYREMLARLDGVRFVAIHMPFDPAGGTGHLRTPSGFDQLVLEQQDLTQRVTAGLPPGTVAHTLSAYEAVRQANHMLAKMVTAGNAPPSSYAMPGDPVTYEQARSRALASSEDVLAADGSSALLLVFLTAEAGDARQHARDVQRIASAWHASGGARVTGEPQAAGLLASSAYVDDRNARDVRVWGAVSLAAVSLVLLAVVRRPTDALLAALGLAAATAATFGLVGWLGVRIDFLTVFLAPIVAGIGMDYAVHVLHAHDRHVRSGARPRAAMARALEEVGPAVAVAAGTTAAGLLVLATVPAPLFARIGALGAAGVLLGFAASLTIVPAARVLLPAAAPRPRRDRLGEGFAAAGAWSLRHPRAAVALVAGPLLVAALAAATLTRVESGAADNELPADDPLLALQKRVEREYGSFQRAYLVVRGDIADAEALRALDAATLQARTLPLWRSSSSIADLVRADAATDEGLVDVALAPARRGDGLPETDAEASAAIARLWRDPLWRTLAPFTVSRDATLAVVAIQLQPWEDQHELRGLRDALQQQAAALQARLGPAYDVQPAGAPLNRAAVIGQTPEDVRVAVFGAAAASFAVLAAAWSRSWRTAAATAATVLVVLAACLLLLASIPALDAAYDALARLGAAANSASLTAMFLLAFAVTACVGLDGLVQVVHRARATRDPVEALRQTGRPVAGTALTTMAAFAPLSALYFLQSKNLAVLVALGALYCLLLTMVLAPWIARLAIPRAKAPPSGGRQEAPAKPAAQGGAPGARPRARNVPARDR